MKMKKWMLTAAVVAMAAGSQAAVIFSDDFTGGSGGWGDLNLNLAARQAGGSVGSTYTAPAGGPPGSIVAAVHGFDDSIFMRQTVAGSQSFSLDQDFGAALSGQEWNLSFTSMRTGDPTVAWSGWNGFSVGSDSPAGAPFANGFGFIIGAHGNWSVFNGGAAVGSGNVGGAIAHDVYDIEATMNEGTGLVAIDFSNGALGTVNLGSFSTSFAGGGRYVDFRNHVDDMTGATYYDMLTDNIVIETIPEPATLGLFALIGGGMLWIRKRTMR